MTTTTHTQTAHPHVEVLRAIYADLQRLPDYAVDDIVLHRADRSAEDPRVCRGVQAVLAHEQALVRLTGNTLVMDVQHITANDYFGAVLGILRAKHPQEIAMPFCGLWRFEGGRITEHWENAYNVAELQHLFTPPAPRTSSD
ncbi:nuclear transport factor 2 family protein [Streptomyces sp. TRM66268-LWL]|uniref:Nuclear transport factor 2 family protein n=1 Tax=Streptomyces polyasparticus TaxID=2767826 RepID=A0ABR7SVE5_9ACTN|nr:nuclear transport factor 2 family protein [Streptomyces polyasparticus]MBC9719460.1 nuclear transport factor 2 family protein [Streptomyces polyasparticus]